MTAQVSKDTSTWRQAKANIIATVVSIEGEYVNNPNDSGGATNFGITEYLARSHGFTGHMSELTKEQAIKILDDEFWQPLKLDHIMSLDLNLTYKLFDASVNCGPQLVAGWFQRILNALNNKQQYYKDIGVDGRIGNQTLAALGLFYNKRSAKGTHVIIKLLNALQGCYYLTLCERREKDETFLFGWIENRLG